MSITVILQLQETTSSLFPTQKQNTTWTYSFRGLYDWNKLPTEIKDAPTQYLHLQVS